MKEIILIKNGELALKGLNRNVFEDCLIKNLRQKLSPLGDLEIKKAQSTIYIEPKDENYDFEEALNRTSKVFGIAAFSRAESIFVYSVVFSFNTVFSSFVLSS